MNSSAKVNEVISGPDLYNGRRAALLESPELENLDAFLVSCQVHNRYLCGFSGSSALLLLTPTRAHFFTDGRYHEQSMEEVHEAEIHIVQGPLRNALGDVLGPWSTIGFEANRVTVEEADLLSSACPRVSWEPVSGAVERLRMVKDEMEAAALQKAADIACAVLEEIAGGLKPGSTELEIAGIVEESLRRNGSEGSAFEPIVVSGLRGAKPHGLASVKEIEEGDCVTIDFGAISEGYNSDITRTFAVGEVDRVFEEWQEILDAAIDAALAVAELSCPCQEVDRAARGVIDEAGLGDYFVHNLGHGLGLEVHEGPHISRNSSDSLAEGMTFTIEPGIYVPGQGGMRIEEDVLLTADGTRLLTHFSRSLRVPES